MEKLQTMLCIPKAVCCENQEVKELPKETMQKEEEGAWAIVFVRFGPSFLDFRT